MSRKLTHRKKGNKSKLTAKKHKNKIVKHKNMKGGGEMIGGFVNMVEYLKDFEPDPSTTDSSKPRILDYIDYHGAEISILCRWQQLNSTLLNKKSEKTYFSADSTGNFNIKTFYDFDDFIDEVIQSLKNIEKSIAQALKNTDPTKSEFNCLSMLTKYNVNAVYPYYLLAKTSDNDLNIDV
jgi:hypothetical protein